MTAADELERAGLRARMVGGRLQVGPPDRLTAEARALLARLAAALRAELSRDASPGADPMAAPAGNPCPAPPKELTAADPAPRYRAWRVRRADASSGGIVMDPTGMTETEALKAIDRWPGSAVEPLPRSRVD